MTKQQYVGKASACFIYLTVTMFWLIPAFGQTTSTALRFSADGQQVLVPHTNELDLISGELTIESWVKPDASLLSRGYSSIVSKQLNGTGYMTASNLVGPEPGFKAEVAGIQVTSQSRPVAGVWQHVAAVWDGQLKIYVNGQLNGVINTGPPIPNTLPLWIGSSPFGADTNFRGDIDEVRIWAVARSQEEIQSTMNQYLCGDEIGLRAYWSFDEGSGQQVIDTLGRSNGSISGPAWVPGVQLGRRPCQPPVSFVGPKTFPAGADPRASAVGDFNRDGNKDLAVANSGSNDVSVLLGNGDGTFRPPVNFLVGGSPNSIVMDYFNGDSFQDLAVANGNSISVLLGNGNGTFQPALNFPAGTGASSIERGDFNLDHRMDLIVRTDAGFAVHLGNGNGTFRAPLNTGATGNYVVGYFNNDGILDVAYTDIPGVLVRFGNGDGTFQTAITGSPKPPSSSGVSSIATGYFNRDAIADLAVTYSHGAGVVTGAILLGNGDGTFRTKGDFSPPTEGGFFPPLLAVDDFNGDNIADLLVGLGGVSVQLGRGDGTFRGSVLGFVVGFPIVVADFNGDGRKDLAGTGSAGVSVALGYGDGTFQTAWNYILGNGIGFESRFGPAGPIVALGEFNGDGIKDLAATRPNGRLSVLLGNGDGSFQYAFEYSLEQGSTSIVVGEFNGDGIQDLVIDAFGSVRVLLGNGNGTFQPPVNFPTASAESGAVVVGYFNGDRYQDIAVATQPPGNGISVLLGNGEGTFQAPLSFDIGAPPSLRSLAVGDFDRDGSQDLVANNASSVSVLLGNGDGTFRAPLLFNTGPSGARSVAVGDFNSDHIEDLAVAIDSGGGFGGVSVLLGIGNGTFHPPSFFGRPPGLPPVPSVPGAATSIAVGDFNSDGIHDLVLGKGSAQVLVGNGDGTFQEPVSIGAGSGAGVRGVTFAVGRLSGDGRFDIAVGGCETKPADICVDVVSVRINNTP